MEALIRRKRQLNYSKGCNLEELMKHRKVVQAVRDFPSGCGVNAAERKPVKSVVETNICISSKPQEPGRNKPSSFGSRPASKVRYWDPKCTEADDEEKVKVNITIEAQRQNFDNVNFNIRMVSPNGEDKLNRSKSVESSRLKSDELKELGRKKARFATRSNPACQKEAEARKPNIQSVAVSRKEELRREKIKEAMTVFEEVYESFFAKNKLKPKGEKVPAFRVPSDVAKIVKEKLKWWDIGKTLGHVCGVRVGDKFKYRAQLMMFGLHCQPQSGIDYTTINGKNLAISVVDSHRYSNESGTGDTLIYTGQGGQGGFGFNGNKSAPKDQTLEKGNLAMKNSIDKKTPVRVIRKVQAYGKDEFVYDGLYTVDGLTEGKSAEGMKVFKFHLSRVPGQASLKQMLKW